MKMKKITVSTADLLKGIDPLFSIINSKHIIPILSCVKIEMKDGKLYFTGDNHEVSCINIIERDGLELDTVEFGFCTEFDRLALMLKNIPSQDVVLTVKDNEIVIKHKRGDFKLPTFPVIDFPVPQVEQLDKVALVSGKKLKSCLKVANKFLLNDGMESMANVSVQVTKKAVTVRSTNRHTLFYENLKGGGDEGSVMVSGKSSTALASLLDDEDVELRFNENLIHFRNKSFEIVIVQQVGEFPIIPFDRIVDTIEGGRELEVVIPDFIQSVRRAKILSDAAMSNRIKLSLTPKKIEVTCQNVNQSTNANEKLKAKFEGELIVGYNAGFIIEVLSVFGEDVKVSINDKNFLCLQSGKKKGLIASMGLEETTAPPTEAKE
jgi:DNA polymerase-3 subunit beta